MEVFILAYDIIYTLAHQRKSRYKMIKNSIMNEIGGYSLVSAFISLCICGITWVVLLFYNFPVIYTVNADEGVTTAVVIWRDKERSQYEHNRYYLRNCTSKSLCEVRVEYGPVYTFSSNSITLQDIIFPKETVILEADPITIMRDIPKTISVKKDRFSYNIDTEYRTCIISEEEYRKIEDELESQKREFRKKYQYVPIKHYATKKKEE